MQDDGPVRIPRDVATVALVCGYALALTAAALGLYILAAELPRMIVQFWQGRIQPW